ncbi:MAG: transcription elongation factor subunit Spt4 [Candidatus Micrarchaeota archaeon]
MVEKACKACHYIIPEGHTCPNCNSSDLTERWSSYMVIFDPEKSELAKKIGAKTPGKYAVRIKQ